MQIASIGVLMGMRFGELECSSFLPKREIVMTKRVVVKSRKMSSDSKKKLNKSAEIRNLYLSNPESKPSEIVDILAKKGIEVSAQQVSTTRMNAIKAGLLPAKGSKVTVVARPPRRRGRPPGSTKVKSAASAASASSASSAPMGTDAVSMTALVEAKKLVERVGMDNAKNAMKAIESILG